MLSLHMFCRILQRQICVSRATTGQTAAFGPDMTRLTFYSPSCNIGTSCIVNAYIDDDFFSAKDFQRSSINKPQREPSMFSAGSSERRAIKNYKKRPLSMEQNFTRVNTKHVTLPTEPLGSEGWSKLKDNYSRGDSFETNVIDQMIKMNTDLNVVKSLLSFVAEGTGDISYAFLVKYLVLCVTQNRLEEVSDMYDIMKKKFPSLDSGANSLFVRGLGKTDRWRESIAILETMKKVGSVSARNYADCVKTAIEHHEAVLAWTLYDEMIEKDLLPPEYAIGSLFNASQDLQDDNYRKRLTSILDYFRANQIYPGEELMKSIKSWFESLPNESWRGQLTKITAGGHCQACKQQIESIHLTLEEYSILKEAVIESIIKGEDTFRKTTPEELQKFLQFVKSRPAYDIVVDGLNVAFHSNKTILSQALLDVVSFLSANKKRVLLLGRKHMLIPSRKWQRQDMQNIQRLADCFFLDNITLDDPFLLYACINSGSHCCFLTRDLLRDHKACLPNIEIQRLFFKWQRGHQLVIQNYTPRNIRMQPVLSYDTIVQKTDTSFHIPYDKTDVVRASFEVPRTWLCVKREE